MNYIKLKTSNSVRFYFSQESLICNELTWFIKFCSVWSDKSLIYKNEKYIGYECQSILSDSIETILINKGYKDITEDYVSSLK